MLDAPSGLVERQKTLNLFDDIGGAFVRDRWRARLRFLAGIHERDLYLNPHIAFVGCEPPKVYLAYHHFQGADQTLGGFLRVNDLVVLGLRLRF